MSTGSGSGTPGPRGSPGGCAWGLLFASSSPAGGFAPSAGGTAGTSLRDVLAEWFSYYYSDSLFLFFYSNSYSIFLLFPSYYFFSYYFLLLIIIFLIFIIFILFFSYYYYYYFFFLLLIFFPSGFPKQTVSFEPVAPSGRAPATPQGAVPKPARLNPWKRDRGAGASSERV